MKRETAKAKAKTLVGKKSRRFFPVFDETKKTYRMAKGNAKLLPSRKTQSLGKGLGLTSDHYRYSRERTSTGQSQMLWTFLVAIAIAVVALFHFRWAPPTQALTAPPEEAQKADPTQMSSLGLPAFQPKTSKLQN